MTKIQLYGLIFILTANCAVPAMAQKNDVGYRKLVLGQSREQVRQVIQGEFSGEYAVSGEASGSIVLMRKELGSQVSVIALLFDQNSILYKINVKMKKNRSNPSPDDVVKVIEDKYGQPEKRTMSNALDLTIYWHLAGRRYEIFFQNITSWDNYEVQYTDTLLQKKKEAYDKERNKKPADKRLDF